MNLFIANAVSPNGEQFKSDKNGNFPILLNVLSGKCPSKRVIAGTMAINMGVEAGKAYMFSWTELPEDETYGRQFQFSKIKELTALEIVQASKELGAQHLIGAHSEVSQEVTEKAFENSDKVI